MKEHSLIKRTWVYVMPPQAYELSGCSCGNTDVQWSEWEGRLWCEPCQRDYLPKCRGVFDGPIPIKTAALMGIVFDRVNLETHQVEVFDLETCEYRAQA